MDYLDSKKLFRQRVILLVGYVLVAFAIVLAALVLVNEAYGFGINKQGTVIQNGLAFFSSQPNPANIYINNVKQSQTTNTRLLMPAGYYEVRLTRNGYRNWRRNIQIDGGNVEHFDYPLLVPNTLTTKSLKTYASAPGFMTQSPDHSLLVVDQPGSMTNFDIYDLKNPAKPVLTSITLPAGLLTKATKSESWTVTEWADDNQHVLLRHNYDGKTEFILVDLTDPTQSVNLNTTLSINPTSMTLNNKKYNQYYIFNSTGGVLETASINPGSVEPLLSNVLTYQSYGNNTVVYVDSATTASNKVEVKLRVGTTTYNLRSLPAGTNYLLDLTGYSGTLYVVIGAVSDNVVDIYQDPVSQLTTNPTEPLVPIQVLRVPQPNYLSFSPTAQYIVIENSTSFGVYDIENKQGYIYASSLSLDSPQTSASWMDGNRLTYVSGGKLVIFDYDNTNQQKLVSASSNYLPEFSANDEYIYALAPVASGGQYELGLTSLLTPADQ